MISSVSRFLSGVMSFFVRLKTLCQAEKMLNCLIFYLDGEIYTSLYPLDARHPDPPHPVGISEITIVGVGDNHSNATA
jgi:hypothetical protein